MFEKIQDLMWRERLTAVRKIGLLTLAVTAGCASPEVEDASETSYRAQIRRTSFGVAHIEAEDLPNLGFGEGFAQAEDHLCSIADQVLRARGERAKFFGEGPDRSFVTSDLAMRVLRITDQARAEAEVLDPEVRAFYEGFVSGYNTFLEQTGVDAVPGWCQAEPWVRPLTLEDLVAYHRLVTLVSPFFADSLAAAVPPASQAQEVAHVSTSPLGANPEGLSASNGWAIGRELSASGGGMLLANPHYPWMGSSRFWEKHLVIPGRMDAYGVGLIGVPGVAIGFNQHVGWTHTVSAGKRYALFLLRLVEGDPTSYVYDGEPRQMTSFPITVEVLQQDGSLGVVEQQAWWSHFGPIVSFPGVGWSDQAVLALRDVNQDNEEARKQWLDMSQASSLAELQQAHATYQGMPWVNTIAVSADGEAWYTDSASTPYVSAEGLTAWQGLVESHPLIGELWRTRGMVTLPGWDSTFEWVADDTARDSGVVPFSKMPQLSRSDYVFNANDSFWMANSAAPIEGSYSPFHGPQRAPLSLRTRNNDLTLRNQSPDRPAGDDGKFELEELAAAIFSNRSLTAELLKQELVERCRATSSWRLAGETIDLTSACEVLSRWDNRFDVGSRGAVLFREWIGQYAPDQLRDKGDLFAQAFDPDHPIATPNGLAPGSLAIENLARAVQFLNAQDLPLEMALGELQHAPVKPGRIPLHGGHGAYEGVMNMQQNRPNTTTLEPLAWPKKVPGSRFLTEDGYPVGHGSSFVMVLAFGEAGPRAQALLTYSQSGDRASEHFIDQTKRYSAKKWREVLYTEEQVLSGLVREYLVSSEK